jgi:hypothetical protein
MQEFKFLTKTMPIPHEPDHVPPTNEIQFLWPKGVGPTEMRGFKATDIRKSKLRLGCGSDKFGCGYEEVGTV